MTSLTTINLGRIDMESGLQEKPSPLPDGILIPVLMETGMDRQTALTVNLLYDVIILTGNVNAALSKTGTTLNELQILLDTGAVTNDVKEKIEEHIKQEKERKEQEEKKRQQQYPFFAKQCLYHPCIFIIVTTFYKFLYQVTTKYFYQLKGMS